MFLLFDLFCYMFSLGSYSKKAIQKRYPLNVAWEGTYEKLFEEILSPGDLIVFHKNKSKLSWAVQYFTKSDFSHIATYFGNGEVFHSTLSGTVFTPLKYFFENNYKMVFVKIQGPRKEFKKEDVADLMQKKYPLGLEIRRMLLTLFGIPFANYRITFALDFLIFMTILNFIFSNSIFKIVSLCIYISYLLIVFVNFLLRNKLKITVYDPGNFIKNLPKDFYIIPSVYKLNEPWFINMSQEKNKCQN